jgi:hypothetical protein
MKKQATHITGRISNADQTFAAIVADKEPKNRLSSLGKALVMSSICIAVLAGLASQPVFAGGTALRYAYVTDPVTGSIFRSRLPLPPAC